LFVQLGYAQTTEVLDGLAGKESGTSQLTSQESLLDNVIKLYGAHLTELQGLLDEGEAESAQTSKATAKSLPGQANESGVERMSLQTTQLQPGGVFKEVHLGDYPALPDVPPTSSILNPTPFQLQHKAEVEREVEARKRFLRGHPPHDPR
jgi:hypothetical protein